MRNTVPESVHIILAFGTLFAGLFLLGGIRVAGGVCLTIYGALALFSFMVR